MSFRCERQEKFPKNVRANNPVVKRSIKSIADKLSKAQASKYLRETTV